MRCVVLDFETTPIEGRPKYPPDPVGVALITPWSKRPEYYAWGHPTKNNCNRDDAVLALRRVWDSGLPIVMHNTKFDLAVAEERLGLPAPLWTRIHDTMLLAFLNDPRGEVSLKPLAAQLLNMPPEERDAVGDWLVANQPVPGEKLTPKSAPAWISRAPGDLVGQYAIGDVVRTQALYEVLHSAVTVDDGMGAAYDRERKLIPILMGIEKAGLHVSLSRLVRDCRKYARALERIDLWLCRRLGADINVDSDMQLFLALSAKKLIDPTKLPRTATGKPSMARGGLPAAIGDKELLDVLLYRGYVATCLRTFLEPWKQTAKASGGLIYTSWNQVRGEGGGARTGRLSSSPNFQNMPSPKKAPKFNALPAGLALPPVPVVRGYIVPSEGCALIDRDYSQQELRILACYARGAMLRAYQDDPNVDMHTYAQGRIVDLTGRLWARDPVKTTVFGLIYGMGVKKLAAQLSISLDEAKQLKASVLAVFPGIKDLYSEMRQRAALNQPIRTWGGRVYYCEKPALVKGRIMEFDYKMVNVLIQGSAADCTKEAVIRYDERRPSSHRPLLTAHDELLAEVPIDEVTEGHGYLRSAMEGVEFDVPMLSEGKSSSTSWATLR